MNSCLLNRAYDYGDMLKAEHPVLGVVGIVLLVLFLLGLPARILGGIGALIRTVIRLVMALAKKAFLFVSGLPWRLLKALFAVSPRNDPPTPIRRANMQNPYFYDVHAKPPPKPQKRLRKISPGDMLIYFALTIDFLLIIDDYYYHCAMLDSIVNPLLR